MLMTAAAVRVLIEHVTTAVAVGGVAGGCSNLITSIGTGKDPDQVSATGCKTDLSMFIPADRGRYLRYYKQVSVMSAGWNSTWLNA